MDSIYYIILFVIVLLYIANKRFRLTDVEYLIVALIFIILSFLLYSKSIGMQFEHFVMQNIDNLYDIPEYVKTKIGGSLDRLIEDSKPKEEENDETVFSKESVRGDPDLQNGEEVDDVKYNKFKREYVVTNQVFSRIKELFPKEYSMIFTKEK